MSKIRRVDKDYLKAETKVEHLYKEQFGRKPSQTLSSKIIANLALKKNFVAKIKKRKLIIR